MQKLLVYLIYMELAVCSGVAGPQTRVRWARRVTALGEWKGRLVVGGMDGAWVREGAGWRVLPTGGEETTSVSAVGGGLAVTTAAGAFRWSAGL